MKNMRKIDLQDTQMRFGYLIHSLRFHVVKDRATELRNIGIQTRYFKCEQGGYKLLLLGWY